MIAKIQHIIDKAIAIVHLALLDLNYGEVKIDNEDTIIYTIYFKEERILPHILLKWQNLISKFDTNVHFHTLNMGSLIY